MMERHSSRCSRWRGECAAVALGNVRQLVAELKQDGITGKLHRAEDGSARGGRPLTAGPLYHILANRIYLGETVHKGVSYAGQHSATVPQDLVCLNCVAPRAGL